MTQPNATAPAPNGDGSQSHVIEGGPPTPESLAEVMRHATDDAPEVFEGLLTVADRERGRRPDLRALESKIVDEDRAKNLGGFERGQLGSLAAIERRTAALVKAVEAEGDALKQKLDEIARDADLSAEGRRKREAAAREAHSRRVESAIADEAKLVGDLEAPFRARLRTRLGEVLSERERMDPAERRAAAREMLSAIVGMPDEQVAAAVDRFGLNQPYTPELLRMLAIRYSGNPTGGAWPRIALAVRRAGSQRAANLLNDSRAAELALQGALLADAMRSFEVTKSAARAGVADLALARLERTR